MRKKDKEKYKKEIELIQKDLFLEREARKSEKEAKREALMGGIEKLEKDIQSILMKRKKSRVQGLVLFNIDKTKPFMIADDLKNDILH